MFVHRPSGHSVTGEDLAARMQFDMLTEAGFRVKNFPEGGRSLSPVDFARGINRDLAPAIRSFEPDVVHLHKWFPDVGRHDFDAFGDVPVVATIHNFRPLCPVGTLFRDGQFCSLCATRRPYNLVLHGCHPGGRARSLAAAAWRPSPGDEHSFFKRIDRFVVPSQRAALVLQEHARISSSRMDAFPSFVPPPDTRVKFSGEGRSGLVFVGQLESTKGIRQLLEVLPASEHLTVIGTGSLERALRSSAGSNVKFLGSKSREEVLSAMSRCELLIFPSTYLETQGLVVGEAALMGTPVVALRGTAGADQVEAHGFGVVIDDMSQLGASLRQARGSWPELAQAGSAYWEEELRPEVWLVKMIQCYEQARDER